MSYIGNFIVHGTRLGGGLRFWREDGHKRLGHSFDQLLQLRTTVTKEDKVKAFNQMKDEAIAQIRAYIHRNLDLRGIHTADSINLGRCQVNGKIRLESAHVGGNLRVYIEAEETVCEAQDFKADGAHIGNDADLRGLNVNRLTARDLQVSGNMLLACPESDKKDQHARINDTIDLEGMHTEARLVLSSNNLNSEENDATQLVRINLARCNIGQLSIRDFDKSGDEYTFPHKINLFAIQVDDWRLEKNEQVLTLLKKTEFDADNYIDIEHRLARIGDKGLANEAYRAMRSRSVGSSTLWGKIRHGLNRLFHWLRLNRLFDWLESWLERLNWFISDDGTRPLLMAFWLIVSMIPTIYVLEDSRNVEFLLTINDEQHVIGIPYSDGKEYKLEEDWGWENAIGLSMSYAIPFYGSRPDVVRARLKGGTCLWKPSSQQAASDKVLPETDSLDCQTETGNGSCDDLPLSPHEFAMIGSVIQFVLWIMIAANLPTSSEGDRDTVESADNASKL